ncbi:hypothetical protein CEB3_c21660 [Peptococcaceae bacterium CEB3]|nr:hypothetical protein CEB3_c21660 [Peptococcaceae bacterium CEB3]
MWNKASFLVIGLKAPGFPKLILPVPLFVLEDFLVSLGRLAWLGKGVWQRWAQPSRKVPFPRGLSGLGAGMLQDLRRHKDLRLIDVETAGVIVYLVLK